MHCRASVKKRKESVKQAAPFFVIVFLIAAIVAMVLLRAKEQQTVTVYEGNTQMQPVELVLGRYQDTQCGMAIRRLADSAQVVSPDGRTRFFDDVGCMALWIENKPYKDDVRIWVYARDAEGWIDGTTAWYSLSDETPMRYGFAPYRDYKEGYVDFKTLKAKMLKGENMKDPRIRKALLGNG